MVWHYAKVIHTHTHVNASLTCLPVPTEIPPASSYMATQWDAFEETVNPSFLLEPERALSVPFPISPYDRVHIYIYRLAVVPR